MGRRLRDVGLLEEPEDVFHLRLEELEAINDLTTLENAEGCARPCAPDRPAARSWRGSG